MHAYPGERCSLKSTLAHWGGLDPKPEQGQSWALVDWAGQPDDRGASPCPPCQAAAVAGVSALPGGGCGCGCSVASSWVADMCELSSRLHSWERAWRVAGSRWLWVCFSLGICFINVCSHLRGSLGAPQSSSPDSGHTRRHSSSSRHRLCSPGPQQVPRGRASCTETEPDSPAHETLFLLKMQ